MNTQRPMFLDLTKMKFPPMAIVSILHRLSGVILFLLLPYVFYLLQHSLDPRTFAHTLVMLHHPCAKFFMWVLLSATAFHFIAGVRHLFMDIGLGEELKTGRMTAYLVILLSAVVIIALGAWLWV